MGVVQNAVLKKTMLIKNIVDKKKSWSNKINISCCESMDDGLNTTINQKKLTYLDNLEKSLMN